MNRLTRALAMASARHPWRTIASWVLAVVAVFFFAAVGGGTFVDDFSAPGSQSSRAMDLVNSNFPEAAKGNALVVFQAPPGTTLDEDQADVTAVLARVARLDHVASVTDPFQTGTISEDGHIGTR